jgi:DNA-directed RNA polymerase
MGNLIWDAILVVVEKPVTGKEYFQSVAKEMADWEKGLMWFTPTGLPVLQNLKKRDIIPNKIRVTIDGKTVVRKYPKYTNEIDSGEQANAVAPNFVHSFDSSHLQLSVTAAFEEGMKNFLVIHDSFSTDAISAGRFNHIIREQFVEMYRDSDWVNRFHDDCEEQLGFELSTPRERQGDFDIEQVLESEYFFS